MNRVTRLLCILLATCCTLGPAQASHRTIHLVDIGWHVGIVLAVDETLRRAMPELAAFPDADFIEIGWGDADFYPAKAPGVFTALQAALLPTAAVIHLHGFSGSVTDRFARSDVLAFRLSPREFAGLLAHINAGFDRGGGSEGMALGEGLYGASSRFYNAKGKFHLARTCNSWAAEALASAGVDIKPGTIITSGGLMAAARKALAKRPAPP